MTTSILTFLMVFSVMVIAVFLIFVFVVSYSLFDVGYRENCFWKEFKADCKWGLTNLKVIIPMILAAFGMTIIALLPSKKEKLHDCPHCICTQHTEISK
jgi:uncharacterized BrkB/YihY/UPF0761 family membrane protein